MVSAAAATAEQGEIVAVSLRVIPGDQAQQRGFTRPVGADDLPVLTRINRPAEVIKNRAIVVSNHPIAQHNARLVRIQPVARRRRIRLRQGNTVQFLAVGQLRNQRLPKQYGFLAGFGQATVRQHACIMYEIRDLIKAVQDQYKGVSLLVKRRQQRCQLRAGLYIQSVKRFIQIKSSGSLISA